MATTGDSIRSACTPAPPSSRGWYSCTTDVHDHGPRFVVRSSRPSPRAVSHSHRCAARAADGAYASRGVARSSQDHAQRERRCAARDVKSVPVLVGRRGNAVKLEVTVNGECGFHPRRFRKPCASGGQFLAKIGLSRDIQGKMSATVLNPHCQRARAGGGRPRKFTEPPPAHTLTLPVRVIRALTAELDLDQARGCRRFGSWPAATRHVRRHGWLKRTVEP